jgi:hypothetical protein
LFVLQIDAALNVNPKLKLNPRNQDIVLYAITRIDLSKNSLTWLPPIIFQLPSLRSVVFKVFGHSVLTKYVSGRKVMLHLNRRRKDVILCESNFEEKALVVKNIMMMTRHHTIGQRGSAYHIGRCE